MPSPSELARGKDHFHRRAIGASANLVVRNFVSPMQSEDPLKADVKLLQDIDVSSMCGPGFAAVHQCGNTYDVVDRYFGLNREISV